ncbi:fused signal recognition particle receptor [Anaerosphaera aminiphila DSM 21120]|uniref:Signal recognition particle receptor FtsY n=1 Tax=Anaerosphaera aminiphila DSM 21120 TaxID=1120995 RepID=A0A1M5RGP9_9FIRM|nr:signal recognition particle-docking protein FtsY [Anaerosphaera aminiphila]SHH25434.1 fused signal recognition particle receptor [Anaerosphaera aminiphila DSM 21120]
MFKWIKDKLSKNEDKIQEEIAQEEIAQEEVVQEEVIQEEIAQEEVIQEEIAQEEVIQEEIPQKEIAQEEVAQKEAVQEEIAQEEIAQKEVVQEEIAQEEVIQEEVAQEEIAQEEVIQEEVIQEEIAQEEIVQEEPEKVSIFQKLKQGLSKTRHEMGVKINTVLGAYVKIDDEMLEDIEDILVSADIGMQTTMKLIDNLRTTIINEKVNDPAMVKPLLKKEVKKLMNEDLDTKICDEKPTVILVVGVNGVGKTTTIGKLSNKLKAKGKKVLIAAGDTFRAAAIDQLKTWGDRAEVDVIAHTEGADPAAVIFDGISAAKSRNCDVLICDTAGRLHNKANLMQELEKINRIIDRGYPEANRETLLVLDATTGQNAMNQAKTFKEVSDLSGIVLTKLDGTAKGGVVIALQSELQIPIKLVGVGEGIDDLQEFNMDSFIDAIFD